MGTTLVGLTNFQYGVELDETGVNIQRYSVSSKPEFKDYVHNKSGNKRGFAGGDIESDITLNAQVAGSTGIMAATAFTALTLANDVDNFGQTAGGVYVDEFTQEQSYNGFREVSVKMSRNAGIT